jgi:exoribonuclease R
MYLFKPMDPKLIPRRVAWKAADPRFNHWVVVNPMDDVGRIPRAELVRVLGACGDWTAEASALLQNAMPHTWPKKLPEVLTPPERPLLEMPTVHIDPPDCRDIDDAISIQGNHFAISIADVSAWLELNPWLKEAEHQCATL